MVFIALIIKICEHEWSIFQVVTTNEILDAFEMWTHRFYKLLRLEAGVRAGGCLALSEYLDFPTF